MQHHASETIHATTVAIAGRAVVITGASGAGKSDLALRLIDRGAMLVADDQTTITRDRDQVRASAPATIAGLIEVRGIGIVPVAHVEAVPVALVVRLGAPERLPEAATCALAGVQLPEVALDPLPVSAPIKVELALRHAGKAT